MKFRDLTHLKFMRIKCKKKSEKRFNVTIMKYVVEERQSVCRQKVEGRGAVF